MRLSIHTAGALVQSEKDRVVVDSVSDKEFQATSEPPDDTGDLASDPCVESETEADPGPYLRPRSPLVSSQRVWGWRAPLERYTCAKTMSESQALIDALRTFPLLRGLEEIGLARLADMIPLATFEDGACVATQGEVGDCLYVVLSGVVERYSRINDDFKGKLVAKKQPGTYFGELAMLYSTPRTLSAYAKGKCVLAKLSRDLFQKMTTSQTASVMERRLGYLPELKLFETLSHQQISLLVAISETQVFAEAEEIHDFFRHLTIKQQH